MKTCSRCNKEIQRSPHANFVKYCHECREIAYKEKSHDRVLQWGRDRRGKYAQGKLQCLICMQWYRKVLSHVWQCHGVLAHEYKDTYGIEQGKGLIDTEQREVLREHVKQNAEVVVKKNLINKGKMTRFKKGDASIGRYTRSKETLDKLRVLYKKTHAYKKNMNNIPECYQTAYNYYYDKEEPMSNTQKKVEKHAKLVAYLKRKLNNDADSNKLYELLELEKELAILEE